MFLLDKEMPTCGHVAKEVPNCGHVAKEVPNCGHVNKEVPNYSHTGTEDVVCNGIQDRKVGTICTDLGDWFVVTMDLIGYHTHFSIV